MTKKSLGILALGASLFAAGALFAQSGAAKGAAKSAATPESPKQQKLIRVSTLNTVQANQEFQNNVQVMQAQRQRCIEANAAYEKETNATKKKELKARLDELLAQLNRDNQTMLKTYGFSLDRNYTLVPEVSHVYMFVTDEEAAKFEKEQAAAAAKAEKDAAAAKKKK